MMKPERNIWWLIIGICGLSVLGWFTSTVSPANFLMVILLFVIIGVTIFFSSLFLLKIVRRAALVTFGVMIWLVLRLLGLRDYYYPVLLVPVLISLEMLLRTR